MHGNYSQDNPVRMLDTSARACFNFFMTSAPASKTAKTCQCGCGEAVARNFRPGHDAKLKGRLLTATKSADWWTREAAVNEMVDRRWGHFVDAETLGTTPVRSRFNGQFVESRHIDSVGGWSTDEAGVSHSYRTCKAVSGKVEFSTEQTGWACSTCVHTHELAERVGRQQLATWVMDGQRKSLDGSAPERA